MFTWFTVYLCPIKIDASFAPIHSFSLCLCICLHVAQPHSDPPPDTKLHLLSFMHSIESSSYRATSGRQGQMASYTFTIMGTALVHVIRRYIPCRAVSQAEALWESKSQIAGLACQDTRYKGPVYQTARLNNNNQKTQKFIPSRGHPLVRHSITSWFYRTKLFFSDKINLSYSYASL